MSTTDVIELLRSDHEAAGALLGRFGGVALAERASYFYEVVTELVRHEVAEEHVVYPIIRHATPGGEQEATVRIAEQTEIEERLAAMEKLDAASAEFVDQFTALRQAVLDHASAEEATTFPLLGEMEDADSRRALGGRYEHAKAKAPAHPHPHAPHTSPANAVFDPVASLFDRARDAVRGV
jgi:hemerythrin superfamily protein